MRKVFADTLYWVALAVPQDPSHTQAMNASANLGDSRLFTTDEVLTEFLNMLSGLGSYYRKKAVKTITVMLQKRSVTVLPQTRDSFMEGVRLYQSRADKGYSLTDCISMNACRREGITDVLTNDKHFAQEGFVTLISR